MKSMQLTGYGPSSSFILADAIVPSLEANEILVKVHAAGINPLDWKIRAGSLAEMLPFDFPLTLGCDIAGVVAKVGIDVKKFRIGDEVYGMQDLTKQGGYAQYVAINEQYVALKPTSLSFIEAASIPMVGLTSWQSLLNEAHLQSGERVLIHGGAGGVGSFAIQLAKSIGAYVATTGSKKHAQFLVELGADHVIDYEHEDFATVLNDFDVVLDTIGGEVLYRSYDVLKPGGRLISLVELPNDKRAEASQIQASQLMVRPSGDHLDALNEYYVLDKIKTVVYHVLPLENVAQAHLQSETQHTQGKIVLELPH